MNPMVVPVDGNPAPTFEAYHTVLLVAAYSKNRKDDLTNQEKAEYRKAIARMERSLSERFYH